MGNKIFDLFFYLIRCAVRGDDADKTELENLNENEWSDLADLAARTKTTALLYPVLAKCGNFKEKSEKVTEWHRRAFVLILHQMDMTRASYRVSTESKKRGLSPVFIKGVILADLYPHYSRRKSSDMDILVAEHEKADVVKMLEDLDYVHNTEHSKNHVQIFTMRDSDSVIELHTRLWEDYEGQKIDVLKSLNLTDSANLVSADVCGFEVLTLEPGRHLTYQMFHLIKHFMLDAIGSRYLIDITLFIEKYRQQINFGSFWESMDSLGYSQFCRQFFILCGSYIGLDTSFFMDGEPVPDENALMLLSDIMNGGTKAGDDKEQWQLLGYMTPYFVGEKTMRKTSFGRKLDTVFLRPKDLQGKFVYAKKHKFLLPVAWVHRTIAYFMKYNRRRVRRHSVSEKMDAAERRLNLLNGLGLINGKK